MIRTVMSLVTIAVACCTTAAYAQAPDYLLQSAATMPEDLSVRGTELSSVHASHVRSQGRLRFEANQGQHPPDIRFLARAPGGVQYYFTEHGVTIRIVEVPHDRTEGDTRGDRDLARYRARQQAIRVSFPGARPRSVVAAGPNHARVNYLIGGDRSRWRVGIPTYDRIVYRDLYQGIDLVYYDAGGQLEYDFMVAPDADPGRIRIRYEGLLEPLALEADGRVRVPTIRGPLFEGAPIAFEKRSLAGAKPGAHEDLDPTAKTVEVRWQLEGPDQLSLAVRERDPVAVLHIDPIVYSTYLGGSGSDRSPRLLLDMNGDILVVGNTTSTDFPTTPGVVDSIVSGEDNFIAKFTRDTRELVFSSYFGGSANEAIRDAAMGPDDSIYLGGVTFSADLPTVNAWIPTLQGITDAYLARLNADATDVLQCTYIGGTDLENDGYALAVDADGAAYVCVYTKSSDFPTTPGAYREAHGGDYDIGVVKIGPAGGAPDYSTLVGGPGREFPYSCKVGVGGELYFVGFNQSGGYPTVNAIDATYGGLSDAIVTGVNATGSDLLFSTYLGGSQREHFESLALGPDGSLYMTGRTSSVEFPLTPDARDSTLTGESDVTLVRLSSAGALLYSTLMGGSGTDNEVGMGVDVDGQGNVCLVGRTSATDFPVTLGAAIGSYGGGGDGFVAKIDGEGALLYSSYLGGSGSDTPKAVVPVPGGVLVSTTTNSLDFPTTGDAFDATANGGNDVALTEFVFGTGTARVTGIVYMDENGNGVRDKPGEVGLPNWFIRITPGGIVKTRGDGSFEFAGLEADAYTVSLVGRQDWEQTQPSSASPVYSFILGQGDEASGDFGVHATAVIHRLSVTLTDGFPAQCTGTAGVPCTPCCGDTFNLTVRYANNGTVTEGTCSPNFPVRVTLDLTNSRYRFDGLGDVEIETGADERVCWSVPAVPSAEGFSWLRVALGNLVPGASGVVRVSVRFECGFVSSCGELNIVGPHTAFATIQNPQGGQVGRSTKTYAPRCSCDPNDKHVTPPGCGSEGFVAQSDSLTYLVRFQNVGTGPAFHVVIKDTLDANLDVATVQPIASSHANLFEVAGRELTWTFWGIVLPDSASDEPASHGWVQLRVRALPGLPSGTVVENGASIYFDRNDPVVTNAVMNTVTDTPVPRAGFTMSGSSVAVGESVDFQYTGGTPGASFLWFFGADAEPETSTAESPSGVVFWTPGPYTILQFVTLGECTAEPAVEDIEVCCVEWSDAGFGSALADSGNGAGVAWGDYDGDGDLDLYLSNQDEPNRLLRNEGSGVFSDVTNGPLGDSGRGQGVAWADYDNDGDLDLYLANSGQENKLFRNDGGSVFVANPTGTEVLAHAGQGTAVAWVDYDNDGRVDLYVANAFGESNRLYRNLSNGSFQDVTASSGPLADAGHGVGVAWADYDDDGDLDVYLANAGADKLIRNDGAGVFVDVTAMSGIAPVGNGTAAAWGDYDNDGDLDLYVGDNGNANRLYRNDGAVFVDVTSSSGPVGDPGNTSGIAWGDYDNDGGLDLYVANTSQGNQLLRNRGDGTFEDYTPLFDPPADGDGGTGVAFGDHDGDGDLDLYLAKAGQANRLFQNEVGSTRHWLQVSLVGTQSNRSAIGARVVAWTGSRRQIREVEGGAGFLSQNSLTVEFGLDSALVVDSLRVRWPSGQVQALRAIAANQRITITEPGAVDVPEANETLRPGMLRLAPNPFADRARLQFALARPEVVVAELFDVTGRRVRTLHRGRLPIGAHDLSWDGLDEHGAPVRAGLYWVRLRSGDTVLKGKLLRLR